jgi:hypothetical protein
MNTRIRSTERLFAVAALALWCASLHAGQLSIAYRNDTGGNVNDWDIFVPGGNKNIGAVESVGRAPNIPMPNTDAGPGGGPFSGGRLSGANVPAGGTIGVRLSYQGPFLGSVAWCWTLDRVCTGATHFVDYLTFASVDNLDSGLGSVTAFVSNTADVAALYSNFVVGTSADDRTIGPFTTTDLGGGLGPNALVYGAPISFTLAPGETRSFTYADVPVSSYIGTFGNVVVGSQSFSEITANQAPEPGTVALIGIGLVCFGVVRWGGVRIKRES